MPRFLAFFTPYLKYSWAKYVRYHALEHGTNSGKVVTYHRFQTAACLWIQWRWRRSHSPKKPRPQWWDHTSKVQHSCQAGPARWPAVVRLPATGLGPTGCEWHYPWPALLTWPLQSRSWSSFVCSRPSAYWPRYHGALQQYKRYQQ